MNEEEGIALTRDAERKLGNLVNIKDEIIADAIRQRGGGQGQVSQLRSDYQNLRVGEIANLAAEGDEDAITAIKILKQARKKREKYGNQ
ncbi:hypothetical protein NG798_17635 [Ancylothrix sp. C2]|uniref:hypothetical protein n=1 Tax=Ancylothrix sp. D3o TaxID=2953691 RepID=UPI0021BAAB93|nr:hypothetical protein [Ancylothrix sp. D3o]MCT7951629.1 hypothetical protein [Ancylothrix sp. D3o]